jgi:arginine-tRNA-protein transferase
MTIAQRQLPLYQTPPHSCGYLPGMIASNVFVDPDVALDAHTYSSLLSQGFRRSGSHIYRPWCDNCQACVPVRLPVTEFRPTRSQRRAQQTNRDLVIRNLPARFETEHYALYQAYTRQRHEDGDMASASAEDYQDFLIAPWADSRFVEFRLDGRVIAVAVTDVVNDAMSAVYTFFDPDLAQRSLGVFAILTQIEMARSEGLPWLYLGYWIGNCRKMAYKARYRPLELLHDGCWQHYDPDQQLPGELIKK